MFTGLIAERGRLLERSPTTDHGSTLVVEHSAALAERLELGASLAVSGVCLTVVEINAASPETATSTFELSLETLDRSNLGDLEVGDPVNLEPALRMGDAMGGHWVQGHVDAVTELVARPEITIPEPGEDDEQPHRSAEFVFAIPAGHEAYLVEKGSVTLDGVSLTVANLEAGGRKQFSVWFVPHTLAVTTFGRMKVGSRVNFEADVLAKYVERAVAAHAGASKRSGDAPS